MRQAHAGMSAMIGVRIGSKYEDLLQAVSTIEWQRQTIPVLMNSEFGRQGVIASVGRGRKKPVQATEFKAPHSTRTIRPCLMIFSGAVAVGLSAPTCLRDLPYAIFNSGARPDCFSLSADLRSPCVRRVSCNRVFLTAVFRICPFSGLSRDLPLARI
jgi:hypothetical protein